MSNCGCGNITLPTGANGIDGYNAYTVTAAGFTMPAVFGTVTLNVSNAGQLTGLWAMPTQQIFVENAGTFEVITSTPTTILVQNNGATGNAAPLTVFAANLGVSPTGIAGAAGTNGTDGTSVIVFDNTASASINSFGFTPVKTATIPADFFQSTGDSVEFFFQLAANLILGTTAAFELKLFDGATTVFVTTPLEDVMVNAAPVARAGKIKFALTMTGAGILTPYKEASAGIGDYALGKFTSQLGTLNPFEVSYVKPALAALDFTQPILATLSLSTSVGTQTVKVVTWQVTKLKV